MYVYYVLLTIRIGGW